MKDAPEEQGMGHDGDYEWGACICGHVYPPGEVVRLDANESHSTTSGPAGVPPTDRRLMDIGLDAYFADEHRESDGEVTRVEAAVAAAVAAVRADTEEALALHTGLHQCLGGSWYSDNDPTYRGTVATHGPCPTAALIRGRS